MHESTLLFFCFIYTIYKLHKSEINYVLRIPRLVSNGCSLAWGETMCTSVTIMFNTGCTCCAVLNLKQDRSTGSQLHNEIFILQQWKCIYLSCFVWYCHKYLICIYSNTIWAQFANKPNFIFTAAGHPWYNAM